MIKNSIKRFVTPKYNPEGYYRNLMYQMLFDDILENSDFFTKKKPRTNNLSKCINKCILRGNRQWIQEQIKEW